MELSPTPGRPTRRPDAEVAEFGRRAGFRCQWRQLRGGSSPLLGTSAVKLCLAEARYRTDS